MRTTLDIASLLEARRREQKVTYDELASAAGLTPLATRRALKAETAPRITTLMALADRLGLEVVLVPKAVAAGLQSAPPSEYRPLSRVEKLSLPDKPEPASTPALQSLKAAKPASRKGQA